VKYLCKLSKRCQAAKVQLISGINTLGTVCKLTIYLTLTLCVCVCVYVD